MLTLICCVTMSVATGIFLGLVIGRTLADAAWGGEDDDAAE